MHDAPDADATIDRDGSQSNAVLDSDVPQPAEATDGQRPRLPFAVVGIGASAGGLEAYTEFLKHARADSGMAFVLVQHLSPKHESMMAELLASHTRMPVLQVEDGIAVEPDHVYVIRPGYTMTIRDGRLHLGQSAASAGHRRPVDDFFRSLAEEQRERAIAVILSGTGSNGTAGAGAIKAVGGLCVAQEPEGAKFPSMPRSLIDSGYADAILEPAEMFEAIARFARHAYSAGDDPDPQTLAYNERLALNEAIAVLRSRVRHDFSGYKKPTLVRRVQRRMSLLQMTRMSDYVRALRQTPAEVRALADDLMIHVTGFFRDPEVWDAMAERVIRPLVADRADEGSIRCWVTACSTGEEAYTLGILLLEAAEAAGKRFDIKIFATDTAERSLGHARGGRFAGGIESELTPARLERWFEKEDVAYRVKKELRELVVFAPQNVLQDPPFSRLDIATCRNLLIYIEPEVQRRVLQMLHFGLCENGALLLGTSETITGSEDLFVPVEKKLRIYRRTGVPRRDTIGFLIPPLLAAAHAGHAADVDRVDRRAMPQSTLTQLTNRVLLERHTPAAVVVDRMGRIVYYHGPTGRFLEQPRGEPTRDVIDLGREEIRGALRNVLQRSIAENEPAAQRDGVIGVGEDRRRIEIHVAPLDAKSGTGHFLVTFEERADPAVAPPSEVEAGQPREEIAQELSRVRDELQSTIEELQTSNEEMKASHEEVTSVNEELQSTNEELETSKEELQSLNEELTTVNAQLHGKMDELERATNDLGSLLSSTDIAVIFLDTSYRIRRFTPAVRDLIELIPSDLGRPLSDLKHKFVDAELPADMKSVLRTLVPIEREIDAEGGRGFVRRVLPYRTSDNRIDGIVVTFVDINARRQAETALRASEERYRALVSKATVGICETDVAGRLTYANDRFCEMVGRRADESLVGVTFGELSHVDDRAGGNLPFERAARDGTPFEHEYRLVAPGGGVIYAASFVNAIRHADGRIKGLVIACVEVTAQRGAGAALRESEARFRAVAEAGPDLLWEWDAGGLAVWYNQRWYDFTGQSVAQSQGAGWLDAIHADDRAAARAAQQGAIASGEPLRSEQRVRAADGAYRWFVFQARATHEDPGGPVRWVGSATDIHENRLAVDALRESDERFRLATETAHMGFWDRDLVRDVVASDAIHNEIYGLPARRSAVSSEVYLQRVHPEDRPALRATLRDVAQRPGDFNTEIRVVRDDHTTRWVLKFGRSFTSADGTVRRIIGGVIDITDRKLAEHAVNDALAREQHARAEAEAANATKDQFLANASHELRTPLSAILIWSKLLSKTIGPTATKQVAEALDAIERSAESQKQLIDDLLDSSRITAGKMRLDMVEVALGDVVTSAVDAIRPTADGKRLALSTSVDPAVGVVWADADRVRQIVWNLLTNAVKFTPARGRIDVGVKRRDNVVLVTVADSGRGIDPAFLPRVFERFRQADVASSRTTGGLGLGLAIVKELVELHNGTVRVESAGNDAGVTFTIELPMARID